MCSPSPPPTAMPLTPTDERPRLPSIKQLLLAGELQQHQPLVASSTPGQYQQQYYEHQPFPHHPFAYSPPALPDHAPHPSDAPVRKWYSETGVYHVPVAPPHVPLFANPSLSIRASGAPQQPQLAPMPLGFVDPAMTEKKLEQDHALLDTPNQFRSLRACAECRRRKVGCTTLVGDSSCQRCTIKGIPCLGQPKTKRKKPEFKEPTSPTRSVSRRRSSSAGHPYHRTDASELRVKQENSTPVLQVTSLPPPMHSALVPIVPVDVQSADYVSRDVRVPFNIKSQNALRFYRGVDHRTTFT